MKSKKIFTSTLISLFLVLSVVQSVTLDYYIIVEENGNSLVIITMYGSGLVNIPIQEDVEEIKVKGTLYRFNDSSVDVSIGSTEEAVVLYKTSLLTKKEGDIWNFEMDLTELEKNEIIVVMSNKTIIRDTVPAAFIESTDFLKLIWEDNPRNISVEYSFKIEDVDEIIDSDDEAKEKPELFDYRLVAIGVISGVVFGTIIIFYVRRKKMMTRMKNKQNIMKTLPTNENKIVSILLENRGEMKRSGLERKSGIAKSSLASALKNLEKKNIVELDKTYRSHYVKLTKWFNEL